MILDAFLLGMLTQFLLFCLSAVQLRYNLPWFHLSALSVEAAVHLLIQIHRLTLL